MAELNNNMEQNTELNEQEVKAAEAAVNQTVPAAAPEAPAVPEKKKLFAKGSKSRKIGGGILIGIGTTILTCLAFAVGKRCGKDKASGDVIDGDYTDVTDTPADDTVPFDDNNTDNF